MDGFVDRLHALRFLRACDPSYGALTFTLVGLPPTGYISLLLDILFGSFLPSLWSSSNQSLLGSRSRHCYAIKCPPDNCASLRCSPHRCCYLSYARSLERSGRSEKRNIWGP